MCVGRLKDCQLKLHVQKDVKPVAQPVRRISFGLRDKVDKNLDELLKENIIGGIQWSNRVGLSTCGSTKTR